MRALVLFATSVVVLLLELLFAGPRDEASPATEDNQIGQLTRG